MQITEPQFWAFLKKGGPKMFFELLPHHKHTTYTEISSGEKLVLGIPNELNKILSTCIFMICSKLYIPSTLNIDLILWHTQLIVCAVKC